MPFNEALFWFGIAALGVGPFFIFEGGMKKIYGIVLTAVGILACAYSVYRHYYPEALPQIPFWIIIWVLTWVLLGYNIYLRRFRRLPPSPTDKSKEPSKLVIHRAVYGFGPSANIEITETLNNKVRDGLVIPVDNNLVDHDPALNARKRLELSYSYGDGTVHYAYALESTAGDIVRLVLPEDSEKQKLKTEISHLQKHLESSPRQWRERFINPQWAAVTGNRFVNTTVEMDGKAFRHCRFENVTLLFHGNAPTELTVDNQFSGGTLRIDTDDPAIMMFLQLQMIISKIPGVVVGVKVVDHKGNAMPDNFSVTLGAHDQQVSLQEQAEQLSDEIREFLKKLGSRPIRKPSSRQNTEQEELEAPREHSAILTPWLQRLQGGWVGRFADRAEKMRYLLAEQGVTDIDLDMALRSSGKDENNMLRIADRLLLLSRTESRPL